MFGFHSLLGLAATLTLAGTQSDGASSHPAATQAETDVRLEHFVLEIRAPALDDAAPAAREVGLVCMRRRPIEGYEHGMQLECECLFRRDADSGEPEHVLHVERLSSEGPRLVWREWGPSRARSLTAEWTRDGKGLRMVESCRGGMPRETLAAGDGAVMPLYLLELARGGGVTSGKYRRLDPLTRDLETIELATSNRIESGASVRVVEFTREDGSLAGRFEFRGADLVSFQWQEGDLVARRITAQQYAAKSASTAVGDRRPR
jgi:hypothetical protein